MSLGGDYDDDVTDGDNEDDNDDDQSVYNFWKSPGILNSSWKYWKSVGILLVLLEISG